MAVGRSSPQTVSFQETQTIVISRMDRCAELYAGTGAGDVGAGGGQDSPTGHYLTFGS